MARHLASILNDSGLRKKSTFVETSAQKLKDMGPGTEIFTMLLLTHRSMIKGLVHRSFDHGINDHFSDSATGALLDK